MTGPPVRSRRAQLAGLVTVVVLLGTPLDGFGGGPARSGVPTPSAFGPAAVRAVDDERVKRNGIRKLTAKHLLLYTDLAPGQQIDALPALFDAATAQWCHYFGVQPKSVADWQVRASLMRDNRPFAESGLLPRDLPPFRHGFSRGREIWCNEQPTVYYRRHLLLHEGTHAFMNAMLGGCGPPWYMEGMAELLATHWYRDGRLILGYFPTHRDDVPMLGRIALVQHAVADGRAMPLPSILAYQGPEFLQNEPYAWSWAVATLMDTHPRYRRRFRAMHKHVRDPDFTKRFRTALAKDWRQAAEEWQLFAGTLAHRHDIVRTAIDFQTGVPLAGHHAARTVAADRGWQNTRLWVEADRAYRIEARGRYQVADQPRIWWCEPGGVTLRYYRGRPLGILLGTVRGKDRPVSQPTLFLQPFVIGTGHELVPESSGTLYLKVNDSPGALHDNAGTLDVVITPR